MLALDARELKCSRAGEAAERDPYTPATKNKVGVNTVTSGGPDTVTATEPIPCYRQLQGPLRAFCPCA